MSGLRRTQVEGRIQAALVEHIERRKLADVVWLHVPNGGRRDARTGAMLKRQGVRPGAPDLLFWHRGCAFALELKAPNGRPTEAQLAFMAALDAAGVYTCIAEGLDQAIDVLLSWGLIR